MPQYANRKRPGKPQRKNREFFTSLGWKTAAAFYPELNYIFMVHADSMAK